MASARGEPASPSLRTATDLDSGGSVDTMLASALQRNMSFTEDRKRQHTPGTANRPRRLRKAEDFDCDDLKENSDPVAPSTKKVTPSRLACIKQLEQEMTCSVCLDICVRPCTTPCGHDFCRKCLKQALQHQRRCPKCRTPIATSAPICINTVLWNTIKLLFPKHAANAPESPADAILTPSSANNAALVANAVAALPMRRIGLIHGPFNPPRRVHAQSPQQRLQRGAQRAPPSWLEGATRDSDPPASNPRHRLALSSQQQTLPQALGRWESQAGRAQASQPNADRLVQQPAAGPGGHPSQHHNASLMQRTRSAHANRNAMPSLLDNLQRRLDNLPVPDILHRAHGHPAQQVAAGLEASPHLRVRAFPSQPQLQPQQQPASAARPFVRPQRLPCSRQQVPEGQGTSRQPHLAAWNPHAEAQPQPVRSSFSMPASDSWLPDLPATPEAPRAAAAAERQAVADVLFEEAAGQSAVGSSETVSEDPSWLEDAAAYDAAAAAAEVDDDLNALEIYSDDDDDDDDTPVNGARSQARLNLSHLEHLMMMSDSEEEDEGMSEVNGPALLDLLAADDADLASRAVRLLSGHSEASPPHASATSSGQGQGDDRHESDAQSDDEMALGHDGRARKVLSDVSSRFPTEQLPQQVPDKVTSKPEEAAGFFLLQRRSRQPRACRSLQAEDSDTAAANVTSLQGGSNMLASSDAQAATAGRPALRSSARLLAEAPTAPDSEAAIEVAVSGGQAGICTRRQAKLNKPPPQQSSQHSLSQENASSDDDFAVVGRIQRQGRVLNHATASQSAAAQVPCSSQLMNSDAQTDMAEKPFAMRRNRPRLQLNRKAKGMSDMGAASQPQPAASTQTTSTSSASQQ